SHSTVSLHDALPISTDFGSRPASAVSWRSRAMPAVSRLRLSIGKAGLLGIGYQASPYLAVRRRAGPDSPPTQIGMPPFCAGLGRSEEHTSELQSLTN